MGSKRHDRSFFFKGGEMYKKEGRNGVKRMGNGQRSVMIGKRGEGKREAPQTG